MSVSTQIANYSSNLYAVSPTLLPENIASFITAIALAAKLSLRCSSLLIEALLESVKLSTSFSFGISRQVLINALSTAKKLHEITANATDNNGNSTDTEKFGFLQVLDKYTNLGIYVIHHSFTLVELFALSGLQFTSQTIKSGLMAAEESVGIIDGIFGSNESSRAIASIITLVHHELMNDPEFELAKIGKIAILSGLTKAITAFAILQNVTHKRTAKQMKMTILWKGLVIEEQESEQSLIQYTDNKKESIEDELGLQHEEPHSDIIQELEQYIINASNSDQAESHSLHAHNEDTSEASNTLVTIQSDEHEYPYTMYEVTTTTNRVTTKTTRIRPINNTGNDQPNTQEIVERINEDDQESFMAVVENTNGYYGSHRPSIVDYSSDSHYKYPAIESIGENSVSNITTGSDTTSRELVLSKKSDYHSAIDTPHNIDTKHKKSGLKIMLSSMSKKLSRKKVERQTKYLTYDEENNLDKDMVEGPITTMTSTSTTLRSTSSFSSPSNVDSDSNRMVLDHTTSKPLPLTPSKSDHGRKTIDYNPDMEYGSDSESKLKKRMSWGGLKMRGRRKSISNMFQKGNDHSSSKKKKSPQTLAPPMPAVSAMINYNKYESRSRRNSIEDGSNPYIKRSNSMNSVTSLSSIAHTLKTTIYHTTPSSNKPLPSTSHSIVRSPSTPGKMHSSQKPSSPLDSEPSPFNFPRKHIITNISHFIRYASAAYGESFMRILGIGDIPSILPNSHHPNHHAFAHHTGVSVEDILLSSYTDTKLLPTTANSKLHALVHYVNVDHFAEAIVLTCRGTLGLGDVLTDLTCDYNEFVLPTDKLLYEQQIENNTDTISQPRSYIAHGGMLEAAQLLAIQKGKVFEAIKEGLENYPNYGLVLCGHSLGAGVASLLTVLWSEERSHYLTRKTTQGADHTRHLLSKFSTIANTANSPFVTSELSGLPSGRAIHCYTYGSPCVMSLPLSEYCGRGLVTSVVHAFDIVGTLSLGLLKDFKNVAVSLHQDSHVADEIISRVVGYHYKKSKQEQNGFQMDASPENGILSDEENDQWFWALIKTMRADMKAEKLYPPSTTYLIECTPQLVQHTESEYRSTHGGARASKHKTAHMVQLCRCDDIQARFSEIVFSRSMFLDHSPNMYEKSIKLLNKGYFG
ncbi:hypothetical protein BDB01DRAFT_894173 [Pilobolus umbonatus]|nr:hypothetical protein BDB01DRAFT_894173 [Pilobolus umbonatus]